MAEKWILRTGSKTSGFKYAGPDGKRIRDRKTLERIDALRIPPAWKTVHIAQNSRAPIQVWGIDARGRKQYRYHPRAVQKGEMKKFYRVAQLGRDLPELREKLLEDFAREDWSLQWVAAGILLLISESFIRVGSDKYEKENKTFGVTTFRKSNVEMITDGVKFNYIGKRSIEHSRSIESPQLAAFINLLLHTPGPRLFRYKAGRRWMNITSREVNDYIQSALHFPYTAKDFRTWGGTLRAATVLSEIGGGKNERDRKKEVTVMVRLVASELGNTPTILRKSYVHPAVLTRYLRNGAKIQVPSMVNRRKSLRASHTPDEKALIAFIDEHAPERRKKPREE